MSTKRSFIEKAKCLRAWADSLLNSAGYRKWHIQQEAELRRSFNADKKRK